jgi:transketolase
MKSLEQAVSIAQELRPVTPYMIRRLILEESKRANVGHIGSALSVSDIIAALFNGRIRALGTGLPNRDRFVLSKGHAALALYAALYLRGLITRDQLANYCGNGGFCGVHPEHTLPGVDFSTGSLGHGPAFGAGVALAQKMSGQDGRAYVLVSDAECNEGSLWETVMFAAQRKLSNLTLIVDYNGQQALGKTKDVIDLDPFGPKWKAFGWNVQETDGHSVEALSLALDAAEASVDKPNVIIARTLCGKGVSFMESKVEWHYLPLSDEQYASAIAELEDSRSL